MVIFKLLSFSRNINDKLMLLYNKTHRTTLRLQQETKVALFNIFKILNAKGKTY